jgi:hypothetical protein
VLGCDAVTRLLGDLEDALQSGSLETGHIEQGLSAAWMNERSRLEKRLRSF